VFVVRARRGELVDREQRAVYESGRATYELAGARTFKSRGLAGWLTSGQVKSGQKLAREEGIHTHSQHEIRRRSIAVNESYRRAKAGSYFLCVRRCSGLLLVS